MSDPPPITVIVEEEPGTVVVINHDGLNGRDGFTVRSGPGIPDPSLGVDGDFYIRTGVMSFYGPKTSGDWGTATSLVGQPVIGGSITVVNTTWSMTHNKEMGSADDFNPATWWFEDDSGTPMEPADLYYLNPNIAVAVWLVPVRGTWRTS